MNWIMELSMATGERIETSVLGPPLGYQPMHGATTRRAGDRISWSVRAYRGSGKAEAFQSSRQALRRSSTSPGVAMAQKKFERSRFHHPQVGIFRPLAKASQLAVVLPARKIITLQSQTCKSGMYANGTAAGIRMIGGQFRVRDS